MASFNKVIIVGNLTRDPEVRYLPTGTAVCELGVAVDDSYRGKDGQNVERTVFVDVVVWDRQAENVSKYLSKGSPLLVEGKLQLDQWESKEGEKRNKLRVRADRVQFLGTGSGSGGGGGASSGGSSARKTPVKDEPAPFQDDDDDLPF